MVVQQAASALVETARIYKNQDAEAHLKGESYDDFVKVELPGGLSIDQLGVACSISKHSMGKLKVVACQTTGEVYVHQVASGCTHGEAAGEVYGEICDASYAATLVPTTLIHRGWNGWHVWHPYHLCARCDCALPWTT